MTDTLTLTLRNIRTRVRVGILSGEKDKPQRVLVHAAVTLRARKSYRHVRNFATLVDYAPLLARLLKDWPLRAHTDYLETLCEDVVQFLWQDKRIQSVEIEVLKTSLIPGAEVGCRLVRTRPPARKT